MSRGLAIRVRGLVQGVGFRPAVWRLARQRDLAGRVRNDGDGVLIEAWGSEDAVRDLVSALESAPPPLARIDSIETAPLAGEAPADFAIVASIAGAPRACTSWSSSIARPSTACASSSSTTTGT